MVKDCKRGSWMNVVGLGASVRECEMPILSSNVAGWSAEGSSWRGRKHCEYLCTQSSGPSKR